MNSLIQKMPEEQKWQEPGRHRLCANDCGFFGSPTTLNLCSNCYNDDSMNEQQMSEAKVPVEKTLAQPKSERELGQLASCASISLPSDWLIAAEEAQAEVVVPTAAKPNRCAACRRRVGLTGFTCRCGTLFCGTHRYPEKHGCTFDFKGLGKEEIAKANPVVKAEKLHKI